MTCGRSAASCMSCARCSRRGMGPTCSVWCTRSCRRSCRRCPTCIRSRCAPLWSRCLPKIHASARHSDPYSECPSSGSAWIISSNRRLPPTATRRPREASALRRWPQTPIAAASHGAHRARRRWPRAPRCSSRHRAQPRQSSIGLRGSAVTSAPRARRSPRQ